MAIHKVHWTPSKTVYAFKLSTFTMEDNFCSLEALWLKKKQGTLTVSEGMVGGRIYQHTVTSIDDFFAHFDPRYGGRADFSWDGTFMFAPEKPLTSMVEAAERLTPVLENMPAIPLHYDGWYALR